ncbi:AAEL011122-PA [Aedes aegypti]|uniref:AAEL011122-PA n=2 Tax=Aedes aegypti TaxID=7159 RepID=Q16R09_AEDAE|nr:AAEL011122-PA [Aedes aegypti]
MIFLHITDDDLTIHRVSAANSAHVRQFDETSSLEHIFDDRPDWYGYNVNIWTIVTKLPFTGIINGVLGGVDVEACKAIFTYANMSYHIIIGQLPRDYLLFRRSLEQLLRNGSIHLVISRVGFNNPYGEILVLRDTDGSCLLIPKSQTRNFIYHIVHPFEFNTWLLIAAVILLDVILGSFFPIAFPHNLVMILLFKDSTPDHEQTRWTRFYCFACTVLLFLLSKAYLSKAVIYMTLTRYTPDMNSIAEFISSDIPLLIQSGIASFLNDSDLMNQLLSKTIEDPNFYFHLDSNQYAYFVLCSFGQQLIDRQVMDSYLRHGRDGKRMFYLLNERVEWKFSQMVLQYRFMYYARFKEALSWLDEAGLWDKWLNDVQKKYDQQLQYELRDEGDILFLEDLVAIWYVVAAGWTVSGVTFLVEMIWNLLKRCSDRRGHRKAW